MKIVKPLTQVKINAQALRNNYRNLQKFRSNLKIAPVLKSNAYGHGLEVVAPLFDQLQPPFLVVNSLAEAMQLLELKLTTKILILGYVSPIEILALSSKLRKHLKQLHFVVFDLEVARALGKLNSECSIHLFVDSGMNREGISVDNFEEFVVAIKQINNLKIVGLASHLADADNIDNQKFTKLQLKKYKQALSILRNQKIEPELRHIAASAGFYKVEDEVFNLVRVGLASYGLSPLNINDTDFKQIKLEPVLSLETTLVQIKKIKKGESIGYNCTFKAEKNMTVGLLPMGYFEGLDRRLSNCGTVTLNGKNCPILGRISMNMTSIDLSQVDQPRVGDQVIVYSRDSLQINSLDKISRQIKTIPYQVLTKIDGSVKRIVTEI